MSYITAEKLELLTFFAVEPKRLDPETTWPYNDFVYEVARGEMSLSFAIHPAYKDVRIILKHLGVSLYELNAVGVEDLKYHNDSGRESLEVIISVNDTLWLRIDPSICIGQQTSESDA